MHSHTDFTGWYYPSSGPSVTSVAGVCTAGFCSVGNVGAPYSSAATQFIFRNLQ